MITWYVEINQNASDYYKSDKYLSTVIDTATPFMNHFCKRLSEIDNWNIEDAESKFSELISELPVMSAHIYKEEFIIKYNKWVYIKLTDTIKQIYRESKLNKILA